jgi:stearoyl-CoA desaturase (delta-9 desaturase)
VDKGEDAVAAVGEPVTMALVDAGRAQRFIEQLIERAAELGLDRIGPAGGLLDVDGDDGPVADHRRHHAYADRDGDPHSPWAFGTSSTALLRGIWHAHVGWILNRNLSNQQRFAPDLLADPDMQVINRRFGALALVSILAPALIGGLLTWSWPGALAAFFWASLVRVGFQSHVTWSVNSICHLIGERPFEARDRSTNFWPLALLSLGDSWHNFHHADPTCARHGVNHGQIDISGRVIWLLERLGLAYDARWPTPARLARLRRLAAPVDHRPADGERQMPTGSPERSA